MAIITVSRELAALGDETAHELAESLGYRFIDKTTLEKRMKSYGIEEQNLKKYDEKKPSFLASISQDRDDYLHYLKTAIFAEAENGSCVFIGRGVNMVFKDVPGVISVFLVAPLEIRIERVKNYFHCDEKRARQIIERSDQDRIGFHSYFFDTDWKDPENYHLCINTGISHPSVCASMIKNLQDSIFKPDIEAQNTARLKELSLEQQIRHHIIYKCEVSLNFLEVKVSGDTVTLYGVAKSQGRLEAAFSAAREAANAASLSAVRNEIQVVKKYGVIP